MKKISLAAALLVAAPGFAMAQQPEMNWTQTVNIPKGQNMPRDRADILGIELGDTYTEAKTKLEKLATEGVQPKAQSSDLATRMTARMNGQRAEQPIQEEKRVYEFRTPGASSSVTASFVQKVQLVRRMTDQAGKTYTDNMSVLLSAPSSGHQVIGINRSITYTGGNEPLISDTLAQLKAKMKFEPRSINKGTTAYRFQFDNGQPFTPSSPTANGCVAGRHFARPREHPVFHIKRQRTGEGEPRRRLRVSVGLCAKRSTEYARCAAEAVSIMSELTRRHFLKAAASFAAAAALPLPKKSRNSGRCCENSGELLKHSVTREQLRSLPVRASCEVFRLRDMRLSFVRQKSVLTRSAALANAQRIIMTEPVNSLESIARFEVAHLYERELGGSPGMLERRLEATRANRVAVVLSADTDGPVRA